MYEEERDVYTWRLHVERISSNLSETKGEQRRRITIFKVKSSSEGEQGEELIFFRLLFFFRQNLEINGILNEIGDENKQLHSPNFASFFLCCAFRREGESASKKEEKNKQAKTRREILL